MAGWRAAPAVTALFRDANHLAPHRKTASDGIVGDARHRATFSDHNPDPRGVVHAGDLTHDPVGGWNCQVRAEQLRTSEDRRIKYVIWNRRIFSGAGSTPSTARPFVWRTYSGSNPHTAHMHVSVVSGPRENDVDAWWPETAIIRPPGRQPMEHVYITRAGSVTGAVYRVGPVLTHVDADEFFKLEPTPRVLTVAPDDPLYRRPKLLAASLDPEAR